MCVAGLLSSTWREKKNRAIQHPQSLVFFLLFVLYLIGLIYASNIRVGLLSVEQKLTLAVLPFITITSISLTAEETKKGLHLFVISNLIFTVSLVLFNLYLIARGVPYMQLNFDPITMSNFSEFHPSTDPGWLRVSYIAFTNRLIGPAYLSMFLTFCVLILTYYKAISTILKWLQLVVIIWFVIMIVLMASRMGIFVFLVVCSLNLIYLSIKQKYSVLKTSGYLTAFLVFMTVLIYISPVTRFRLIEEPLSTPLQIPTSATDWNSVNLRFLEWSSGIKGIKENGIMGTGTGGTLEVLKEHYNQVDLGTFEKTYNAHNQYIETFLELGIPGIIALVMCLCIPFLTAFKRNNMLWISLIIMIGLTCISTCVFEHQHGLVFYMAFICLFMFTNSPKEKLNGLVE
jgi:O-antigen ligase